MDFRSLNKFNVVVNALSGNFFPLSEEKKSFNLAITMYMIFIWIIQSLYFVSVVIGLLFFLPPSRAFQEGSVLCISIYEIIILSVYLNLRRGHLRKLIRKLNGILIDSADLRRCVHDIVEPNNNYLKFYMIAAISATFVWSLAPIFKVLKNDRFTYMDYTVTSYVPGEPFTVNTFVFGVFLQVFGSCYCALKKISIDVYISYLVTLLTAEYKYVREQIAVALRRERDNEKDDRSVIIDLKKCVQHHCAVIETGRMLIELMAFHVGLIYINSIFRFCVCGFTVISYDDDYFKQFLFSTYATGNLIQVFMLCSSSQNLLEASTSITDDGFYENWHGRSRAVKNIFSTLELSNQMECRISAYRIVDLVTPTLASILNKAYSACLLLLRNK